MSLVDAQARRGVSCRRRSRGDAQPGLSPSLRFRTPAESRHEDRALADVDRVRSDGGLDVLPVHGPTVHGEVDEDLGAHVLSDVHSARDLAVGLTVRVFEVLRANPEDERLCLELAERGSRLQEALVNSEPMVRRTAPSSRPSSRTRSAPTRFIAGEPMNSATKRFTGWS